MNENIEVFKKEKDKEEKNSLKNEPSKKIPKKIKKTKKKKPEKKCKNLKELLEQIQKENTEKLLKEKKIKEKEEEKKEEKKEEERKEEDKEEEKEEEEKDDIQIKENMNNNKSTSGTTVGTLSLDDTNMTNYLLINYNIIPKIELNEEKFNIKRKMSSPIFEYYNGYDKILSIENEGNIDLTNSVNFVEKKKFISSFSNKKLNKLNINPKDIDVNDERKNDNKFGIINSNIDDINYNNSMYPIYNNITNGNNDIQEMMNNINNNIDPYYYLNTFSYNYKKYKNRKSQKKHKNRKMDSGNNKRIGDWICNYCFNLNFSFRKSCNRCNAPKE